MSDIKPIETYYNGYRFRSRLEARWAVFFDAAGIKYEYESEGYECDGERYLPDFYLPEMDVHVEVKPDRSGIEKDILRCSKMIQWGGAIKTILFLGDIPGDSDGGHWHFPTLYYETGGINNVVSGWWFFSDWYDDDDNTLVNGHISKCGYPAPIYITNGEVKGMFKCGKFDNVSLKPMSDRFLKKTDPYNENPNGADYYVSLEDWHQFLKDSVTDMNIKFYSSLRKARMSRFEHGECG